MTATFERLGQCWICGGKALARIHDARFDFSEYRRQDPELAEYTGLRLAIVRCSGCGFASVRSRHSTTTPVVTISFGRSVA